MRKWNRRLIGTSLGAALLLAACSSNSNNTPTTPAPTTSGLGCTATGTVVSGSLNLPNSEVILSNINVQIQNDTAGPFTIAIGNNPPQSSASYDFLDPITEPFVTGASGGINAPVTVTDTATGASGTCTLTVGSPIGTGTTIAVTASPSPNVPVGQYVTLIASDGAAPGTTFAFSLAQPMTGVSLVQVSATSAYVTSQVNASVLVVVTEASGANTQYTVTFGSGSVGGTTGGTTGYVGGPAQIYVSESASSAAPGAWIALSATVSGMSQPVINYSLASGTATLEDINGVLYVTASGGQVVIQITATDYATGAQTYTDVPLTF